MAAASRDLSVRLTTLYNMTYPDQHDLALLLDLDGMSYGMAAGYVVKFKVRPTSPTPERPHGINYALVFRPTGGGPP